MRYLLMARLGILLTACVLFFAACDTGNTITVTTTGGTSATTTSTTTCATIMPAGTIPNGTPANTAFADVALPANSFVAPVTIHLNGSTNLYTIYLDQICTQGTSVAGIQSFFANGLPTAGWPYAPKLPFDGGYFAPCGDPYCWSNNNNARMIGLEAVTDRGNSVVTYTLRLFSEPAAPACAPEFMTSPLAGIQTFLQVWSGDYVAMPPQALALPNSASGGTKIYDICSDGTVASLITYMQTELPRQGFNHVSGSGGDQTWQISGNQIHWSIANPLNWEIDWRVPFP